MKIIPLHNIYYFQIKHKYDTLRHLDNMFATGVEQWIAALWVAGSITYTKYLYGLQMDYMFTSTNICNANLTIFNNINGHCKI